MKIKLKILSLIKAKYLEDFSQDMVLAYFFAMEKLHPRQSHREDEAEKTQVEGRELESGECHSQGPDQTQNWIVHPHHCGGRHHQYQPE